MPIMIEKKHSIIPVMEPALLSPSFVVANAMVESTNPKPENGIPSQFKNPRNGINANPVPRTAKIPQIKLSVDINIYPQFNLFVT